MRIAPHRITELGTDEIFVFGSNEAGIHGKGAAKFAKRFGAKMGENGLQGKTYGISTKDHQIKTLSLRRIKEHVENFIRFAKEHPDLKFLVTAIGCGLASYEPEDIAPMFKEATKIENIYLPKSFLDLLNVK